MNNNNLEGMQKWDWKDIANMFHQSDLCEMGLKIDDGKVVKC